MKRVVLFGVLLFAFAFAACKESEEVKYAREVTERYFKAQFPKPENLKIHKQKAKRLGEGKAKVTVDYEYQIPYGDLERDTVVIETSGPSEWGDEPFLVNGRKAVFEIMHIHPNGECVQKEAIYFPPAEN